MWILSQNHPPRGRKGFLWIHVSIEKGCAVPVHSHRFISDAQVFHLQGGQLVSNLGRPLQSSCRPSHFPPDLGVDIGRWFIEELSSILSSCILGRTRRRHKINLWYRLLLDLCWMARFWDDFSRKVYLSMPNYVQHALQRLHHSLPTRLQHAPHRHNKPVYGQKIQFPESQDDSREVFLSASSKTLIQQIIRIFLY